MESNDTPHGFGWLGLHCISSELSRKVHVSKESLILRLGGQVSSIFKLKWVEEVKLYRKNAFDDCSYFSI